MPENPYSAVISRYFLIALGSIGSLTSIYLVAHCILSGHVPELGRRTIGPGYFLADNPSQFWFTILLFSAMGVVFGAVAWRSYRS